MREKDLATSPLHPFRSLPLNDPSCHFNGISLCKPTAKEHIRDSSGGCRLNVALLCIIDYFYHQKKKTSGVPINHTCTTNRAQDLINIEDSLLKSPLTISPQSFVLLFTNINHEYYGVLTRVCGK